MSELHPCRSCRRHVRDDRCPFCGATPARREPIDLGIGRVSRAVVFASATLVAAGACGGKARPASDEVSQPRHAGGGGCVPPDQMRIDELEKKKADAKTDEEKAAIEQELQKARQPQCMPYGAPPARRRIV
jgi:hypothetical protein